jgi:hypothetical protein
VQVELIEAERRFFCCYKWVHGIKFQVIALPNSMIGNVAGKCCSVLADCCLNRFFFRHSNGHSSRSAPLRDGSHQ